MLDLTHAGTNFIYIEPNVKSLFLVEFLLGIPTFLERLSLAACCEPPDPSSEGVSGQNILFGLATFGPEFVELMQVHGGAGKMTLL